MCTLYLHSPAIVTLTCTRATIGLAGYEYDVLAQIRVCFLENGS